MFFLRFDKFEFIDNQSVVHKVYFCDLIRCIVCRCFDEFRVVFNMYSLRPLRLKMVVILYKIDLY